MASKNITKDLICQEALILIKEGGLAKLSMRNLAARLGIKAPSLYVHIKNKADLVSLLQAYTFKANQFVGNLDSNGKTWQEFTYQIMLNMRHFFLTNPWLFELFASYSTYTEEYQQTFEKYLSQMQSYGFSTYQAAYIARIMRVYVIGHVEFEYSSTTNQEQLPTSTNFNENYINTYNFYVNMGGYNHNQSFEFGANLLIDGCNNLLQNSQCQISTSMHSFTPIEFKKYLQS